MKEDSNILALLKNNDKEAFNILYNTYAASIYGLIINNTLNNEEADKILSNVFIQFIKEIKTREFIEEGLFILLYRITNKLTGSKACLKQSPELILK